MVKKIKKTKYYKCSTIRLDNGRKVKISIFKITKPYI